MGCQSEEKQAVMSNEATQVESLISEQELLPKTPEQQQAYALGSTLATRLSVNLEMSAELGVEIDEQYVLKGINDAFNDTILIAPTASSEMLEDLQETIAQAAARAAESTETTVNEAG